MTFFHFGNCVALAYIPYAIVYKYSGLSEYNAFWKCVQAGGAYLFTQLCKMMVLATFFPAAESGGNGLDIAVEFLKCTVDMADLIGLHLIMTRIAGKTQNKFMVAGMGWATSELIMTRVVPLWVGARGVEFDWKYVRMCFDSNVSLMHHISTAMLVWLYSRTDINKSITPVITSLLILGCYKPLIIEILIHAVGLGSWMLLCAKTLFTVCVSMITLQLFLGIPSQLQNSYY